MRKYPKHIPIIGTKYGKFEVICDQIYHKGKDAHSYFKVKCECGHEQLAVARHLVQGKSTKCKTCASKEAAKINQACINFKGPEAIKEGDLTLSVFNNYKRGAISRDIEWDEKLTMKDLVDLFNSQNGKCALTNQEITLKHDNSLKRYEQMTASLDRINSNLPYTLKNLQWIHKEINRFKNNYSQEKFIEMCKQVVNHVNQQPSKE